ncbi:S41 family peptidase [Catenulispora subtropica]|uniref:S41 family peptidase n=1 Tax=Catenulispora subtropica TaxID=450798 RepID=A0ABN2SRR2_9ACTN
MRHVKRSTCSAVAAVMAGSGLFGAAAAQAADVRMDGVWRTDGYGTILRIAGSTVETYDTTAVSCIRDTLSDDDGEVSTFTPGPGPSRARWHIDANLGDRTLIRLPALPAACEHATPATPVETFDVFWRTFAENYPFFAQRGIDWQQVYDTYRPQVTATTTNAQLRDILAAMIRPLHDAHVGLRGDGVSIYEQRPGTPSPSPDFDAQALALIQQADLPKTPASTLRTWCQGHVAYADLPGHIGYLRISEFARYTDADTYAANAAAFTTALDAVFTADRTAGPHRLQGLILDLRVNGGGDDPLGLILASRLTDRPFFAYAKQTRDDPTHPNRFTPPQPFLAHPSTTPHYTGPLAILTSGATFSAAETTTQALLNRTPRPTLIGENSQGVFSDILTRRLPNGWVFGLPNEEYLTPSGSTYDIAGIPPDIRVPTLTPEQFTEGRDPAFRAALRALGR